MSIVLLIFIIPFLSFSLFLQPCLLTTRPSFFSFFFIMVITSHCCIILILLGVPLCICKCVGCLCTCKLGAWCGDRSVHRHRRTYFTCTFAHTYMVVVRICAHGLEQAWYAYIVLSYIYTHFMYACFWGRECYMFIGVAIAGGRKGNEMKNRKTTLISLPTSRLTAA